MIEGRRNDEVFVDWIAYRYFVNLSYRHQVAISFARNDELDAMDPESSSPKDRGQAG